MDKKKVYKCPVCGEIMGQSIRITPGTRKSYFGYNCQNCNIEIFSGSDDASKKYLDALNDTADFVVKFIDRFDEQYNTLLYKYTSTLEEMRFLQDELRKAKSGSIGFYKKRLEDVEEELFECGEALQDVMKKLDAAMERNNNLAENLRRAYDIISDLEFNIESQKSRIKTMEADAKYLSGLLSKKNRIIAQLKQK